MITCKFNYAIQPCWVKIISFITLSLFVVFCSVACSNSTTPTQPIQPPKQVKIARPTLASAVPVPLPEPASEMLSLYSGEVNTLDPATCSDESSHQPVLSIFSGLVCLNDSMVPCADIAENLTVSDDGKTYTFTLRPNVHFQDGRIVTAEDFKFSWERACSPGTKSSTAQAMLGDIVGVDDVLSGKARSIAGVTVVDNATLKVELKAPETYFLYKLTYPVAFVVDRTNVATGDNWWHSPNGTGPFKLSKYEKGDSLILQRNASYYGEKALLESVNYHILSGRPIDLYEKGDIDVSDVNIYYVDRVTDNASPFSKELTITPGLDISFVGFNCKAPPFDDENVRRAFSYAIDKKKIVALALRGMSKEANGILPPGMPGYDAGLRGQEFNPIKAKELIAKSKYAASLPHITMTTSGMGNETTLLQEALIAEWRTNLGVEVDIRQMEPERFIDNLKAEKDQLFLLGWIADYPHPHAMLGALFLSNSDQNFGDFASAKVDALLAEAAQETDPSQITQLYKQADRQLADEVGCIPIASGSYYILVKPYVKGYTLNAQGIVRLNHVSVEPH
ncbi:MAG: peptide ABC transporter substrate-binding protein [Syntrophales bacterium]|nr:peptide ABC transporter substrate-binding protein [Syntrophales bacterium]